ncbi:hypothetical protein ACFQX7_13015 [Luedemannella flava]
MKTGGMYAVGGPGGSSGGGAGASSGASGPPVPRGATRSQKIFGLSGRRTDASRGSTMPRRGHLCTGVLPARTRTRTGGLSPRATSSSISQVPTMLFVGAADAQTTLPWPGTGGSACRYPMRTTPTATSTSSSNATSTRLMLPAPIPMAVMNTAMRTAPATVIH